MIITTRTSISLDPIKEKQKVDELRQLDGWVCEDGATAAVVFWREETVVVEGEKE